MHENIMKNSKQIFFGQTQCYTGIMPGIFSRFDIIVFETWYTK